MNVHKRVKKHHTRRSNRVFATSKAADEGHSHLIVEVEPVKVRVVLDDYMRAQREKITVREISRTVKNDMELLKRFSFI